MKIKFALAAISLSLLAHSNAANIAVSNLISGDGTSDAVFENATTNTAVSTGIVAVGYFPVGFTFSGGVAQVQSFITAFTSLASGSFGSPSAQLGEGAVSPAGYVDVAQVNVGVIGETNVLVGRPLYVFVGNGATLATSTEFAIKQVATIQADVPNELLYLASPKDGVAPVLGSIDTITYDPFASGSASTFSSLKLVGVPEPSVALLGALGVLGLVRRRR